MNQKGFSAVFVVICIIFIVIPILTFYLGVSYNQSKHNTALGESNTLNQVKNGGNTSISYNPTVNNIGTKFILFQRNQAPTGEIVYQTEIPSDWTAYTDYISESDDGKDYGIGMGIYSTHLGRSRFYQGPGDVSNNTNGMITDILIFHSKSAAAISQISNEEYSDNKKTLNVDGVKANQFNNPDQGGLSTKVMFTKDNTSYLIVEHNGSGEGSDIFKHILSSFKVVKGQLY